MASSRNPNHAGGKKKTTARSQRRGLAKRAATTKRAKTPVRKAVKKEPGGATVRARRSRAKAAPERPLPSPEDRYRMIAEAAYFLAEQRNFQGGDCLCDWVAAERQIEALYPTNRRR